jgi:TPR repeat protein
MSLTKVDDGITIDDDTLRKAKQQHDPTALYDIGDAYYQRRGAADDYVTALKYFEIAAFKNNVKAQDKVGSIYCWGNGVEANYDKAIQWYLLAADQGYSKAQYHLGWMYQYVLQDNNKAYVWFLKSAVQGYKHAQYSLGYFHHYGLGKPTNYSVSFQWFLKAGSQQHRVAQYCLGHMYYNGEGAELNKQASLEWFFKAANNGSWEALNQYNKLYKEGYRLLPKPNGKTLYGIYYYYYCCCYYLFHILILCLTIDNNFKCTSEMTDTETQKDKVIRALVKSVVNVNAEKKVLRQKNLDLVAQIHQQMDIFKTIQNQFKKKHQEKEIMESRNIQLELKLHEMVNGIESGLDNKREKHVRC